MTIVLFIIIFAAYIYISADINQQYASTTHNTVESCELACVLASPLTCEYVAPTVTNTKANEVSHYDNLMTMTIRELKAFAKAKKLPKYGSMTKSVLANALANI